MAKEVQRRTPSALMKMSDSEGAGSNVVGDVPEVKGRADVALSIYTAAEGSSSRRRRGITLSDATSRLQESGAQQDPLSDTRYDALWGLRDPLNGPRNPQGFPGAQQDPLSDTRYDALWGLRDPSHGPQVVESTLRTREPLVSPCSQHDLQRGIKLNNVGILRGPFHFRRNPNPLEPTLASGLFRSGYIPRLLADPSGQFGLGQLGVGQLGIGHFLETGDADKLRELRGPGWSLSLPSSDIARVNSCVCFETLERLNCSPTDARLLQHVLELGDCIEQSNKEGFERLFQWLSLFSNPTGTCIPRIIHHVLQTLLLRCTGMGVITTNTPSTRPPKEVEQANTWALNNFATVKIMQSCTLHTIASKLVGKSQVHIITFGIGLFLGILPSILHILAEPFVRADQEASDGGVPRDGGIPHGGGCVVHLRLTLISIIGLTNPGRLDLKKFMTSQAAMLPWLKGAAASAGVQLELQTLDLDRQNLPELTLTVERRPWESLLVVGPIDFDFMLDNSVMDFGIRETILEWVSFLKPLAFAMSNFDLDANSLPFSTRLWNILRFDLALLQSHDALVVQRPGGREHVHVFEEIFFFGHTFTSSLACEGMDQSFRSQSMDRWRQCMAGCGLAPGELTGVESAYKIIQEYPDGYGLLVEPGCLRVTWKGVSSLIYSVWVPL